MRRIDLGCGDKRREGFVGVDRAPLRGVDVIADLDRPLPFRDDSVDLLLASHSLEHVHDLLATVKEIYRICRHGAQICIVAPYSEQRLNRANPYHLCDFNEHTPRFWTPHPESSVVPEEYAHPHAPGWGLSLSDHSDPGIDLRLVRMEFFYFPQYLGQPQVELRRLRQERVDVCDQIMYHLIVWKNDDSEGERPFEALVKEFQPYEPDYVVSRKARQGELLLQRKSAELEEVRARVAQLEAEIDSRDHSPATAAAQAKRIGELVDDLDRERVGIAAAREESLALRGQLLAEQTALAAEREARHYEGQLAAQARVDHLQLRSENADLRELTIRLQQQISSLLEDRRALKGVLTALESAAGLKAKLALTEAELEAANSILALHRQKEVALVAELTTANQTVAQAAQERERAETRSAIARTALSELCGYFRFVDRPELVSLGPFVVGRRPDSYALPAELAPLRDYSMRRFPGASRALPVLSEDISSSPYREYSIPFEFGDSTIISLGLRPAVPDLAGIVGVELVSANSEIVAHRVLPLAETHASGLVEFSLPEPLPAFGKPWALRIFVRDTTFPVQVYEIMGGQLLPGRFWRLPLLKIG